MAHSEGAVTVSDLACGTAMPASMAVLLICSLARMACL